MRYSISLLFYSIFLISLVTGVAFTPPARYSQVSFLIGNKLYYSGGVRSTQYLNDFFYLDLTTFEWVSLTNAPISFSYTNAFVDPLDNSTIYITGGYFIDPQKQDVNFSASVYTYNPTTLKWDNPSTSGSIPKARQDAKAVVDSSGKTYVFGGCVQTGNDYYVYYNDMNIFDIAKSSWSNISPTSDYPDVLGDYTATLLSSGIIVYIGGGVYTTGSNTTTSSLNQIHLFDTKSSSWSLKSTTGVDMGKRSYHTAVLIKDDQIVVYGGATEDFTAVDGPTLAVLSTSSYNWYIPNNSSSPYSPPPLAQHSANLYGNYIIIAFGFIPDKYRSTSNRNQNSYILDTGSFSWIQAIP